MEQNYLYNKHSFIHSWYTWNLLFVLLRKILLFFVTSFDSEVVEMPLLILLLRHTYSYAFKV